MFSYQTTVKMHDTDAAGRLFFAKQFFMFHDAYEAFIDTKGMGFATILRKKNFFLPIVHAQADYKVALFVGDRVTVIVQVKKFGHSSMTIQYELWRGKSLVGSGETVHVAVSNKTGKKMSLPAEIRKTFAK